MFLRVQVIYVLGEVGAVVNCWAIEKISCWLSNFEMSNWDVKLGFYPSLL